MKSRAEHSERPQNTEGLRAALAHETRGLAIGPSPLEAMMRHGGARRRRRRAGIAGVAALGTVAAVSVTALGIGPNGSTGPGIGAAPSQTRTTTGPIPPSHAAATPTPPASKDQVIVLGSGTFNGRSWRLVRVRFIVTAAAEQGTPKDMLVGVGHLPFSDYGKPGTAAREALGIQFGDAAPGSRPDFIAEDNRLPQYATPSHFVPSSFANLIDKTTGNPTYITAIGNGPAAGFNGSTAVSATLTVDAVTSERQPLLTAPGESTAYYAFVVPGTRNNQPKTTVTFYDAQGNKVGSTDAEYASSSAK